MGNVMNKENRANARHHFYGQALVHRCDGKFTVEAEILDVSQSGIRLGIDRSWEKNLGWRVYTEILGPHAMLMTADFVQIQLEQSQKQIDFQFANTGRANSLKLQQLIRNQSTLNTEIVDLAS
jgi:hypothetical protein